jgi:hypothetical protein
MSSGVFRDMFSLNDGSTQKHPSTNAQEPIYLDADADVIEVLFDILSASLARHSGLKPAQITIGTCVALTTLADTYSFGRIKTFVKACMLQHLEKHPMKVLETASILLNLELGRKAILRISNHDPAGNRTSVCWGHPCECGILWSSCPLTWDCSQSHAGFST